MGGTRKGTRNDWLSALGIAFIAVLLAASHTRTASAEDKKLDPCLEALVQDLESKTSSKVWWSWDIASASPDLAEARTNFKIPDGGFCYLLRMRGNQQHTLCGEHDPFKETKFLYRLSGEDDAIVDQKCK